MNLKLKFYLSISSNKHLHELIKKNLCFDACLYITIYALCHTHMRDNKKPYSILKFGVSDSSGGRIPDKLLFSKSLHIKRKILWTRQHKVSNYTNINQTPTYKWIRLGNLESSGGICPLSELLFMWLLQY